jgi:hypothetical protein
MIRRLFIIASALFVFQVNDAEYRGEGRLSLAHCPPPADETKRRHPIIGVPPLAVRRAVGRSGRTPALPYPPERQLHGNNRATWLANFFKYSSIRNAFGSSHSTAPTRPPCR